MDTPTNTINTRCPEQMLLRTTAQWGGRDDLWVFGYASLIARPEFEAEEHRVGHVRALAVTLSRRSPSFVQGLHDHELLHIFKHAKGRFGTTLEYLLETADALRRRGLRDREIERMVDLARLHALVYIARCARLQ